MKKMLLLFVVVFNAFASSGGGFLHDNLVDLTTLDNPEIDQVAKSVATMVQIKNLIPIVDEENLERFSILFSMKAKKRNLKKMQSIADKANKYVLNLVEPKDVGMCKDFEFNYQPMLSNCTGALVAPDVILTAGHCVKIKNFCKKFKWIFDYRYHQGDKGEDINRVRLKDQVFSCARVIKKVHSKIPIYGALFRSDIALVKLDRPVNGRQVLELDFKVQHARSDQVFMVSNPLGLPQKYSEGEITQRLTKAISMTTLPAMSGSSGGPVFSKDTGSIVGVLVRGRNSSKMDIENKCKTIDYSTFEDGFTTGIAPLKKIEKAYKRYILQQ
jgi:V8-like Glu-specific endopeptidase